MRAAYETFEALVGIDDEERSADGAVEFVLVGDGRELWRSGALKKADGAKPVKVEIKGVGRLTLRVARVGEGGRLHADWVDAKLTR